MSSPPATHPSRATPASTSVLRCTALFASSLLALVAVVLALPVFPSGDGPVHIYFSRILFLLASHHPGVYGNVYSIRHLVQPYSLHYFWLIAMEQFTSSAVAEKSFVAAILLINALGFRFLTQQIGASAPVVSLWILPLLLSWTLGSGFLNFCFGAGVLFFAYAFYLRILNQHIPDRLTPGSLAFYVLALSMLVLSHPVPLLLLLLLLIGDLVLLLWNEARTHSRPRWRTFLPGGICFLLACVAFAAPMLIADKASVADSLLHDVRPHLAQVRAIASGDRLSLFFSKSIAGILFTAVLVALAPAGVALTLRNGARQRFRDGQARPADRLCLTALCVLLATLVFPQSMNGSALFADRMVPLLWPFLFACIAAVPLSARASRYSLTLATFATGASLFFAVLYLLPAARQQQALTSAPLPWNAKGVFITAPVGSHPHLAENLLAWGGARAFAAHNDILLNSPWLQLTIVPVRENGASGLLRDHLPGSISESPAALGKLLQTRSPGASQALSGADFLLYSDPGSGAAEVTHILPSYLPEGAHGWQCTVHDFYGLCLRKGAP